jgi:hypothetical protein
MPSADLRARREAVVREHMESENAHDFDTTIATFGHPRYELVATGDVYDGEDAVRGYFAETRRAFPDQRNELVALHHADDAVIVEFDVLGTHLGPLRPRRSRDDARQSPPHDRVGTDAARGAASEVTSFFSYRTQPSTGAIPARS